MTKMIKMSLVAALAVSGLSASIKDSSVSGKFEVEYDYTSEKSTGDASATTTNEWDYDVDATIKTPIADNITAIFTVQADEDAEGDANGATTPEAVDVVKHYISAKLGPATVNVGKQSVGTPFFDDERGNGIVALMPAGAVTLAAANFTNVNGVKVDLNADDDTDDAGEDVVGDSDVSAVAVIGGANNVNYSLWYANLSHVAQAYSLNVNAKVGAATVDFTHSDADYGDVYSTKGAINDATAQGKSASLTKISATMPVSNATVTAAYGMTNDDANRGGGVDLTADGDASANFCGEIYCIDDLRDASGLLVAGSTKMGAIDASAHFLTGSYKPGTTDLDFSEIRVGASKALNKSTKLTAFYATGSIETGAAAETDDSELSMAVEYKF